jgi:hypothetical protein
MKRSGGIGPKRGGGVSSGRKAKPRPEGKVRASSIEVVGLPRDMQTQFTDYVLRNLPTYCKLLESKWYTCLMQVSYN